MASVPWFQGQGVGLLAGGWGFRLREARNKELTLHAIPNICSSYELGCGADAGRAYYAALFHQRLHFT